MNLEGPQPPPGMLPAVYELALAGGSALLAGYVRARKSPAPFSLESLAARCAEAVVCAVIAIGVSAFLEAKDVRVIVGLSAALGLLGTGLISELLERAIASRAERR
ncbi:phage holin family protein [Roseococcus sp. SDR]|uniref:phage holin family protein n=1 Tax=Roseococcus sp. SDR TaxID=2835532 RepID=UPI001BD059E0|nr:phage holin family protein [Roseococcus sp. SDR]MBS7793079.1 phage holin family protein [Roseococcus sp. SDR]MBV1848393.1 phage holin family protein [Roseococcus sp. SDR]